MSSSFLQGASSRGKKFMNSLNRTRVWVLAISLCLSSLAAVAQKKVEDPDNGFIAAKVVEVTDNRVSVIAASGVEHVIRIDEKRTKVRLEGKTVSLKKLREGDVVNIVLDSENPIKFAKTISMVEGASEVASR
jgi:hypothetical protein